MAGRTDMAPIPRPARSAACRKRPTTTRATRSTRARTTRACPLLTPLCSRFMHAGTHTRAPAPRRSYVFMLFVMYCSIGTLTSGYTLYVKWYGPKAAGGPHQQQPRTAPEPTTLRVDMTADGNLSRSRSVKGVELQEVAAEARASLWASAAADDDRDLDLGSGYASFQSGGGKGGAR